MIKKVKKFGYKETKNKQIIRQVSNIIKKNKGKMLIMSGNWEIRILTNGDLLAVYNKTEKYYIRGEFYKPKKQKNKK